MAKSEQFKRQTFFVQDQNGSELYIGRLHNGSRGIHVKLLFYMLINIKTC